MRLKMPRFLSSAALKRHRRWQRGLAVWLTRASRPVVAAPRRKPGPRAVQLQQVAQFGRNPGHLRMLEYVPPGLAPGGDLVVVLHGCFQAAEAFDRASGWGELARRKGFAVLYPEQRTSNNPNRCFNWFRPSAASRDRGEVMSIRQMIDSVQRRHRLSGGRVYVFGLSAGGAMAAALLAAYPDLFSGGAIVGGLPYGAARDAMGALQAMKSGVSRRPDEWGDLVREAAPDSGRVPALSVWHGGADRVVSVANADALVAQWLDVHGLDQADPSLKASGGRRHRQWRDGEGRVVVEEHRFEAMDHGLPVSAGRLGRAPEKRFFLDVGICAATEMAKAWQLGGPKKAPSRQRGPGRRKASPQP